MAVSTSATSRFAPRGDPHDPFRSRWATTTGADPVLDTVASRALSPRAPGEGVMLDIDDTIIEVHGYAKQRSGYGYAGAHCRLA